MRHLTKVSFFVVTILLFSSFTQPDIIEVIKEQFAKIDSSLNNYSKIPNKDINVYKDINPENYSFESTGIYQLAMINMVRYYENRQLRKAVVTFDASRIDLVSEYYYQNDTVFYVCKTKTLYDNFKWSDNFDTNKNKVTISKFYLSNGNLIMVEETDKVVLLENEIDKEIETKLLSDAALYKAIKQ